MYIYVDRWWGPLDSAWWASWLITRLAGVYDSVELVDLFTDGFIIHQTYVEQADLDPVTFPLLQVVFQLIFQTSKFVCIYIYIYNYIYTCIYIYSIMYNQRGSCEDPKYRRRIPDSQGWFSLTAEPWNSMVYYALLSSSPSSIVPLSVSSHGSDYLEPPGKRWHHELERSTIFHGKNTVFNGTITIFNGENTIFNGTNSL